MFLQDIRPLDREHLEQCHKVAFYDKMLPDTAVHVLNNDFENESSDGDCCQKITSK